MKYNFDEVIPRHGTYSVKWDTNPGDDVLPMWVADMDFKTAPAVVEAIVRRAEHGIYGYAEAPAAYYDAIAGWFSRRHALTVRPEWMLYTTGIVPALSALVRALTAPGDKVLVQPPVYDSFFSPIRDNGRIVVESNLLYRDGRYSIDFDDLERCAADPQVRLMLLCNPHNPVGRVWTREELQRIGDICRRNGVFVVADEIHCELVMPGYRYTPFASLGEEFLHNCVTCTSPSKAFNLAGLQAANIFAADEPVRSKIDRELAIARIDSVGPFGMVGVVAAYNRGADWLDELNQYLAANYAFLTDFFHRNLPDYPILQLEGTYLVWIDCRASGLSSLELSAQLLDRGRLRVNPGTIYGAAGEGFVRLNIACPRSLLAEGCRRMLRVLSRA